MTNPPSSSSDDAESTALLGRAEHIAIALAIGTYILQFLIDRISKYLSERADFNRLRNKHELERIEWQLGTVFGPMISGLMCSKASFR